MFQWSHSFASLVERNYNEVMLIDCNSDYHYTYSQVDSLVKEYISIYKCYLTESKFNTVVSFLPNSIDALISFYAATLSDCNYGPCHSDSSMYEFKSWVEMVNPSLCILPRSVDEEVIAFLEDNNISYIFPLIDGGKDFSIVEIQKNVNEYSSSNSKLLLKTSGTTGEAKAMCLGVDVLWSSANAFVKHNKAIKNKFRFYNFLPMSYLGGLFNLGLIPLVNSGSIVVDDTFSAKTYLKLWMVIEKYSIAVLWLTPSIMNGLLMLTNRKKNMSTLNCHGLKLCLLGMAPSKLSDKKLFMNRFCVTILENYGLSETTFISSDRAITVTPSELKGGVGELLPYVDIKLVPVDIDNSSKKYEIFIKTPFLFDGYINKDGIVNLPLDKDGYFITGDIGLIENGRLVILGRQKDFIKKGGYLISLREIEVITEQHIGVLESAATVDNHPFYGEVVNLFVVPNCGSDSISSDDIKNWLSKFLGIYKIPDKIMIADKLPKTSSGKIMKYKLSYNL